MCTMVVFKTDHVPRKTQAELSEKSLEATELREALDERQRELEERVTTVKLSFFHLYFYHALGREIFPKIV